MRRRLMCLLAVLGAVCGIAEPATASDLMAPVPALVASCAPQIHPQTLTAIISVESSGWPWDLHDNTGKGRTYPEPNYQSAVRVATYLVNAGHSVDIGIAQINSSNLPGLHRSIAQILDPCTNVAAGGYILNSCHNKAISHFGPRLAAAFPVAMVEYATSCYNSNSLFAAPGYVRAVVQAAESLGARPFAYARPSAPTRARRYPK